MLVSTPPFRRSNTDWHSGSDFNDSTVEGAMRDVADRLEGVRGGTGRGCDGASSVAFSTSVEDQNCRVECLGSVVDGNAKGVTEAESK